MGKDLTQMIEAVADATTGEFERLKEFGINASKQGDQIALTFQGQTTVIKDSADAIQDYLRSIGDVQFGGAMAAQMDTLGGAFSNLDDAVLRFWVAIGDTGATDAFADSIRGIGGFIDDMSQAIADAAIAETIAPWAEAFGDVSDSAGSMVGWLKEIPNPLRAIYDLMPGITGQATAWEQITHNVGQFVGVILDLPDHVRKMAFTIAAEIDVLVETWRRGSELMLSVASATWANITAAIGGAMNSMQSLVASGVAWIAEKLASLSGQMASFAAKAQDLPGVGDFAAGLSEGLGELEASFKASAAGAEANKAALANNTAELKANATAANERVGVALKEVGALGDYAAAARGQAAAMKEELDTSRALAKAEAQLTKEHEANIAAAREMEAELTGLAGASEEAAAGAGAAAGAIKGSGGAAKAAKGEVGGLAAELKKAAGGYESLVSAYLPVRSATDDMRRSLEQATAAYRLGMLDAAEYGAIVEGVQRSIADGYDDLISAYLPVRAANEDLRETIEKASHAYELGILSAEEYAKVVAGVQRDSARAMKDIARNADPVAEAWQRGADGIGREFKSLWDSLITGSADVANQITRFFSKWLSDLAFAFASKPIQVVMQAVGLGGASGAAAAAGGGGGLGGIGSLFGGNSLGQGLGQGLASLATNLGMMNSTVAEMAGNLASTANWQFAGSTLAGSFLGSMLFEGGASKIGSSIGSAAGAAIGQALIPIPGVGALAGSLLGGAGGGFLGSLFGKDKPRMQANLWYTQGQVEVGDTNDLTAEAVQNLQEAVANVNTSLQQYASVFGEGARDALQQLSGEFAKVPAGELGNYLAELWAKGMEDIMWAEAIESGDWDIWTPILDEMNRMLIDGVVDEGEAARVAQLLSQSLIESVLKEVRVERPSSPTGNLSNLYYEATAGMEDPQAIVEAIAQVNAALGQFGNAINLIEPGQVRGIADAANYLAAFEADGIDTGRVQPALAQLGQYIRDLETPAETAARVMGDLEQHFRDTGIAIPQTQEGLQGLLDWIDLSTTAGRETAVIVGEAIPAFRQYFEAMEQVGDVTDDVATGLSQSARDMIDSLAPEADGAEQFERLSRVLREWGVDIVPQSTEAMHRLLTSGQLSAEQIEALAAESDNLAAALRHAEEQSAAWAQQVQDATDWLFQGTGATGAEEWAELQRVFDEWGIAIPRNRAALRELVEAGAFTDEQLDALVANFGRLDAAFAHVADRTQLLEEGWRWLYDIDPGAEQWERLQNVFTNWGIQIPSTKEELRALYESGVFTEEQIAILVAHLDELGLAFDYAGQQAQLLEDGWAWLNDFNPGDGSQEWEKLQRVFTEWGISIPKNKAALLELVQAGVFSEDQLISLAKHIPELEAAFSYVRRQAEAAISDVYQSQIDAAETARTRMVDAANEQYDAAREAANTRYDAERDAAEAAYDAALEAADARYDDEMARIADIYDARREALDAEREAVQDYVASLGGILSTLDSAIGSLRESDTDFFERSRRQLAALASSGRIPDEDEIARITSGISQGGTYASLSEQRLEEARIRADLRSVRGNVGDELSDAEQQLAAVERQMELLDDWRDEQTQAADDLLEAARDQAAATRESALAAAEASRDAALEAAERHRDAVIAAADARLEREIAQAEAWRDAQLAALDEARIEQQEANALRTAEADDAALRDKEQVSAVDRAAGATETMSATMHTMAETSRTQMDQVYATLQAQQALLDKLDRRMRKWDEDGMPTERAA
ncbi:MAG: hypothetical protein GVY22_02240 [Gammaproteobacteria bacterium]|nr:hypothetical protein [Gammaproteobacteria bacterium]